METTFAPMDVGISMRNLEDSVAGKEVRGSHGSAMID